MEPMYAVERRDGIAYDEWNVVALTTCPEQASELLWMFQTACPSEKYRITFGTWEDQE